MHKAKPKRKLIRNNFFSTRRFFPACRKPATIILTLALFLPSPGYAWWGRDRGYQDPAQTYESRGWKYQESGSSSSPFSFTMDYSLLNGAVTLSDTIEYFVIAQDLYSPSNVAINSGSLAQFSAPSLAAIVVFLAAF